MGVWECAGQLWGVDGEKRLFQLARLNLVGHAYSGCPAAVARRSQWTSCTEHRRHHNECVSPSCCAAWVCMGQHKYVLFSSSPNFGSTDLRALVPRSPRCCSSRSRWHQERYMLL